MLAENSEGYVSQQKALQSGNPQVMIVMDWLAVTIRSREAAK